MSNGVPRRPQTPHRSRRGAFCATRRVKSDGLSRNAGSWAPFGEENRQNRPESGCSPPVPGENRPRQTIPSPSGCTPSRKSGRSRRFEGTPAPFRQKIVLRRPKRTRGRGEFHAPGQKNAGSVGLQGDFRQIRGSSAPLAPYQSTFRTITVLPSFTSHSRVSPGAHPRSSVTYFGNWTV